MKKFTLILFVYLAGTLVLYAQDENYVKEHYSKTEQYIPMRDGARLYTVIYTPKDTDREYPIMLNRTCYSAGPYGEEYKKLLGPNKRLMEDGYVFVYQDVRGRYMSEGVFDNMRPQLTTGEKAHEKAIDESTDTYDTIDWLIRHVENHNGRVGMWGISYPGYYTAVGTLSGHPALKASSPQAPIGDFFFDDFHHRGSFLTSYFFAIPVFGFHKDGPVKELWFPMKDPGTKDSYDFFLEMGPLKNGLAYQGKENFFWKQITGHPHYDEFWQERSLIPHMKGVGHAVMTVGGWFDAEDLYGPLHIYQALERDDTDNYNTLVMGPWSHGDWARKSGIQQVGDICFGDSISAFYQKEIEYTFFTHFLKGSGDRQTGLPEAYVFDTGKKEWHTLPAWPPENAVARSLFLHNNGELSWEKPSGSDSVSTFVSDPAKPVPYSQAREVVFTPRSYMTSDQRDNATRPDVLVFETDTLMEDMTLAGDILAGLQVAVSGTDADWIVKLIDVFPAYTPDDEHTPEGVHLSNYHMLVRSEIMPGRYRNSFEKPEPLEPGKITEIQVPLQDVFHTFKKGHRIQVQIQSTWFPLFSRNPQKFVPNIYEAEESDYIKATHKVYHNTSHPSRIEVTVLE